MVSNLSIFNSNMLSWKSFIRIFALSLMLAGGGLYGLIALVDPYDSLPISLPLERKPISTNQRFAYPSLARNVNFNSAIIGTSTSRLLKPKRLNELTGNNWVNLAMNSATAYEQIEMFKLYLRHHPNAKNIVLGIDDAWCQHGQEIEKYTFRPFPPWMFDENPLNDYFYLFNDKALENAVRLIEFWSGKREAKYDETGFRDFTLDFGAYDIDEVRRRMGISVRDVEELRDDDLPAVKLEGRVYPSHKLLTVFGHKLSQSSAKAWLVFMPMNGNYLRKGAANYQACKASIHQQLGSLEPVEFIDFMKIDELTKRTENYWDSLHFRTNVAELLENSIAGVAASQNR